MLIYILSSYSPDILKMINKNNMRSNQGYSPKRSVNKTQQEYNQNSYQMKSTKTRSKRELVRPTVQIIMSEVQVHNIQPQTVSQYRGKNRLNVTDRQFIKTSKPYHQQADRQIFNKNEDKFTQAYRRYQSIQQFLQNENNNLKQHNNMLMGQLKLIRNREKRYKDLYHKNKEDINLLVEERDAYAHKVQELKEISENQIKQLQKKLNTASFYQQIDNSEVYEVQSRYTQKQHHIPEQFTSYTNHHSQ